MANTDQNKDLNEDKGSVIIGPALPPQFKKEDQNEESLKPRNEEPPVMGPALPPHMLKKQEQKVDIGPQLPPNMLDKKEESEETPSIGPQLPPHLRQQLQEQSCNVNEEEDEEDVYGPLPAGASSYSRSQMALEERALQLKMDQLDSKEDKTPVREEWMLELPEVRAANLGLGPRQFRAKAGPDFSDRSSWTDTPNKKAKKEEVDLKKEAEMKEIRNRNEEQEKISKKHKKKNKESLLEMHQNEMKKKKKDESDPGERRPFNRETDLQVNRFDEAQKKAILKKAQLLDDRFASGHSKFL